MNECRLDIVTLAEATRLVASGTPQPTPTSVSSVVPFGLGFPSVEG